MATFTIYLLREEIKRPEDAIGTYESMLEVSEDESKFGTLFVRPKPEKKPKWASFFEGFVNTNQLGKVRTTAGAYIVSVDRRFFALTFGQGRFILKPNCFEERFGLLVTLNSVKQNALRSVDKRAFLDEQNSRVQTNHATRAFDFGIDIERDLIRGIVGYPEGKELGSRFAGADSLTVSVDTNVKTLRKLLRKYLKAFLSNDYKEKFPWIEKVRQLRPGGQDAENLDALLVEKLKVAWLSNGHVEGCWMSLPDVVDWTRVDGFKFTRNAKEGVHSDLHLVGLVSALRDREPSIELMKSQYAMAVDEDENPIEKWSAYKCLQCEIKLDGKSYLLSAGNWFVVDADFEAEVEAFFEGVPRYNHNFPIYRHKDEGEYNKECYESSGGALSLMDRKDIYVGGIHDKVEFCDLYGGREIIHVKRYGSSSVLGHLFNQGLVSGELLKSHREYLALVNEKLAQDHRLKLVDALPRDVDGYTVVFCIVSQAVGELSLPFFAKVVLKTVCTRLREFGYEVKIAKISCDQDFVTVQKLKARKRRARKSAIRKRIA